MNKIVLRQNIVDQYMDCIDNLESADEDAYEELDKIVDKASRDEMVTIEEYAFLYGYAMQKANWL